MKTLKELNSKWYWRLLKVIWVIILVPIFLVSILISYGEIHKLNEEYSPDSISNVNLKLNDYKNLLEDLKELKVIQNKILTIIPELVEFIPRDDYDGPDGSAYYMVSRKLIKENLLQINSIL